MVPSDDSAEVNRARDARTAPRHANRFLKICNLTTWFQAGRDLPRLRRKRFKCADIITPSWPVCTRRDGNASRENWCLLVCLPTLAPSSAGSLLCRPQPCKKAIDLQRIAAKLFFSAQRSLGKRKRADQQIAKALRAKALRATGAHGKPNTEEPRRAQHAGSILGRRARVRAGAGAGAGAQAAPTITPRPLIKTAPRRARGSKGRPVHSERLDDRKTQGRSEPGRPLVLCRSEW